MVLPRSPDSTNRARKLAEELKATTVALNRMCEKNAPELAKDLRLPETSICEGRPKSSTACANRSLRRPISVDPLQPGEACGSTAHVSRPRSGRYFVWAELLRCVLKSDVFK